ncbi:tetratricopeptide repeat protein (plasmid) [Streptomyces sp. NBC_01724]|uniref:tetratricopeptide repeat protein n=1 Tax=Streptomyces sp. NBC_01724 TaxID=2975922 RepID=UPI002E38002E|nr:tetratricopeptide repeat protein [Streptomyces sp. NBC_01724]
MSGKVDERADSNGRVYQASGDQHIIEHYHHGEAGSVDWAGIESVRQPTGGRAPMVLRDRTELMKRLQAAVAPGASNQVYVLHGMGGCGKTAVARTLFQFATTEGNRVGLWVNAADRTSLRSGMLAVAADRGAANGELSAARNGLRAPADLVWKRLGQSEYPWLLVLDNADDPEILHDGGWLRASPRGIVLVTTRRAGVHWWPHAELHHVGVLPRKAAAQVLCDLAPETGTMEEAAEIADHLGRLPLALTLAGGFLSHQVIDPWTMTRYGRHLDGQGRVDLIDQGATALGREDARHLITRTWQLSLDALAGQGVQESTALLRLLACFGADPLPLTLLNSPRINRAVPRARAEVALRGLLDQSLTVVVDAGVRCVQTHALLLASVMADIPGEQVAQLTSTAALLLDAVVPAIPERGRQDLRMGLLAPHVLALLHHATDASVVAGALDVAVRLACALHRTGDYLSAWELASAAAAITEPKLGPEHRTVLSAHARTGRALFRLGRFAESETVLRHVLAVREQLFGPDHPDTLDSYFGINHPLQQLGRVTEGITLLRRATDGRERVLGKEHPLTLQAQAHLLEFLPIAELAAEVDDAAMPLPQECALHLGPDHAVTLGARLSYALALLRLSRFEAAVEDARQVAADYDRHYGPDYALTLSAQLLYARAQAALGDVDSAVELMAMVAHRRELGFGAAHPYTARSYELLEELRAKAACQSAD